MTIPVGAGESAEAMSAVENAWYDEAYETFEGAREKKSPVNEDAGAGCCGANVGGIKNSAEATECRGAARMYPLEVVG